MALWITLGAIGLILVFAISTFNSLIALRNRYKNAFAQIDVQLRRRYDLIPNLVETAKAFMEHEKGTLEAVIQARNTASNAANTIAKDPSDIAAMQTLLGAEQALTGAMGKFFALSEDYPELKSNQNMMQLSGELSSTEDKIAFARQTFNDSVTFYNTKRESFPSNIFAGLFGFQGAILFEVKEDQARKAIKVSF